jgi:hypothetical protein
MVDIENSRPKPEPQLTSSLKSLLVNKSTPDSSPKVPSITAADVVTETTDNELISDDERMVLEAQKEAEEAEMLLREAEAEAARVDQELAKLGISAPLLPLVSDEVNSSKEDTPYWQEIEVKVTKSGENSTSTEAATKTSPNAASNASNTIKTAAVKMKQVSENSTSIEASAKADPKASDAPNTTATAAVNTEQTFKDTAPKVAPLSFSKLAQSIPPVTRVNRAPNSINNSLAYLVSLPKNTKPVVSSSSSAKQPIQPSSTVEPLLESSTKAEESDAIVSKAATTIPFSKLTETIPPVARVTATPTSVDTSSVKPVTRTTNLKELLNSK